MAIWIGNEGRRFHLDAGTTSYIIEATPEGLLAHCYWGPKVRPEPAGDLRSLLGPRSFSPNLDADRPSLSLDVLPQEYPTWGRGDYRMPAYQIRLADGTAISDLRFEGYRETAGAPNIAGLPHVNADADAASTLTICLSDPAIGLAVELDYTVFEGLNAIVRSQRICNRSEAPLVIERALSASVDLPDGSWDWIRLTGAWARERHIARSTLGPGLQSVDSRRGASSHQANPFLALVEPACTETHGRVYAMNLIYSGNFTAAAEVDQFETTRMAIGIHPFQFQWRLEPQESFQTPQAVMVCSDQGLGSMSDTFHRLYRQHLMRPPWATAERPIVLNNWEATYFNFTEEKLLELADSAADLGVEVLVLDDGWFGARNDDHTSLGDWVVNLKKLPHGISGLADRVHERGLKFGLWVEPEMVSPKSDLYRSHPDWCLHVSHHSRSEGRNQLVLDLSRPEVCDWIIDWMTRTLRESAIDYIKWDMNRHMTEVGSATLPREHQPEVQHRYMLGLYRVLETLTTRFPSVLFEGCSGGGGRFDPGLLYYMPQTWTSDDSDAIERLMIQQGTSLAYPPIAMTAHVSAIPNHQVGRVTPMATRGWVAMAANFGYELDFTRLDDVDKRAIGQQIAIYKAFRPLIQFGDFHRLLDPGTSNAAAWMFVDEHRDQALVVWVNRMAEAAPPVRYLALRGLDGQRDYQLREFVEHGDWRPAGVEGGDMLMARGLATMYHRDFGVRVWHLQAP